jgi:hypothetical protein
MENEKRYTQEEVTAIVANALRRQRARDSISHEELLETAAELGIPPSEVEEAARHLVSERDMQWARQQWIERERRDFKGHVVAYVIVNGFLVACDLLTSGGRWFWWPLLGWGVGLAFHAYATYFPDPEEIEKGARKILAGQKHGIPEWSER